MKRKVLQALPWLTITLLSYPVIAGAQTTVALENVGKKGEREASGPAAFSSANPWAGAQVIYKFNNSDAGSDNFSVIGHAYYTVDAGGALHLPIRGNVEALGGGLTGAKSLADSLDVQLRELASSSDGIVFGAYPWIALVDGEHFSLIAHGAVGTKTNAYKATETDSEGSEVYVSQFMGIVGLEALIGTDEKNYLTFGIAGVYGRPFSSDNFEKAFGATRKKDIWNLEVTTVFPFGHGVGALAEFCKTDGVDGILRLGLVSNGEIGE